MKQNPYTSSPPRPQATVVCPYCQVHVTIHPNQSGSVVGCPRCGGQFQVPNQTGYAGPAAYSPMHARDSEYQRFIDKKIAAGICGILLGGFGVHKFILGFPSAGTIMLVFWLLGFIGGVCIVLPIVATAVMNVIGLVEGIIYLTKSNEDFYYTYAIQRREWF